ncbi:hypothetical protein O1611_g4694 [Lasiodiplodia mahajangana]|uniref:Uncharacterized protein n=1 Tax=Lasiodiplodia mahajangana TaxID=1108764 RepID=A0ACC2JNY0_9PEZI|nr:hypothetical protein O1611_g4694 [Lasiodiplodia mahajangana]
MEAIKTSGLRGARDVARAGDGGGVSERGAPLAGHGNHDRSRRIEGAVASLYGYGGGGGRGGGCGGKALG